MSRVVFVLESIERERERERGRGRRGGRRERERERERETRGGDIKCSSGSPGEERV